MTEVEMPPVHHSQKAAVSRCLFCGKVGTWWPDCTCEWGEKIRAGTLPKPKTRIVKGVPIIECCAELRAAAAVAGVIRMRGKTEPPKTEPSETEPLGVRAQKRQRIISQILLYPDRSDRAIAAELDVSRNTVATIRASMKGKNGA